LLFAYWSFFCRVYEGAGKIGAVGPGPFPTDLPAGVTFLDVDAEAPLTRANVLAHKRIENQQDSSSPRHTMTSGDRPKKLRLRRMSPKQVDQSEADQLSKGDDPVLILENALRIAAGDSEPLRRAHFLKESYTALANIHSAHGHYHKMLHTMDLALHASEDIGDTSGACNLYVALGNLELKHHRYYAASTRFKDAMRTGAVNELRAEALAGLGWATLAQGGLETASGQFLEALGWMTTSMETHPTATEIAAKVGCRAHFDGFDKARTLALAGYSLVSARASTSLGGRSSTLVDCAAFIFQGLSTDSQDPFIWDALGLAQHSLSNAAAAKRFHQRAAFRQHRDPSLIGSNQGLLEASSCASAADLPSCSHTALHLGLINFHSGHVEAGANHVESLLSRLGESPEEAAEWLIRFARTHAWYPAGHEFGAFLLSRVEALLQNAGDARLAQHFSEYGRFLLTHRDNAAHIKSGLTQLGHALAIIEKAGSHWPNADIAALYSTMGAAQHHVGEVEQAVQSFEKALEYDKKAAVDGKPNYTRTFQSHANLGAARLKLIGTDVHQWQMVLQDFRAGRRAAQQAGLSSTDPVMKQFEASYRNFMRLATHRGILHTCPRPLDALLYGSTCSSGTDMVPQ
jgi:tetratricopeptide (TPR) repeat protein